MRERRRADHKMDEKEYTFHVIAKIHTDFPAKFGIPRQSGLIEELTGRIVFEKEYRDENALIGMEGFSHLWLLWIFSENQTKGFSPTVRPPRLGGNKRMGVFATRSSFRPNPIALSCVRLIGMEKTKEFGTVLNVAGVDLMDGTPIVDIKPYLPFVDCQPNAKGGFADPVKDYALQVNCPPELCCSLPKEKVRALIKVLSEDPRPSYHEDESRIYGMSFAGYNVSFRVKGNLLSVVKIEKEL